MGNSPSQQTAEGAQGEPDDFNLDAISDGSGENMVKGIKKKSPVPDIGRKTPMKNLHISSSPLKPDLAEENSTIRNGLGARLKGLNQKGKPGHVLDAYDYDAARKENTFIEDPDETSLSDTSSNVASIVQQFPEIQSGKTGRGKRKRTSSVVKDTTDAKSRKRQRKQSIPMRSVEASERKKKQIDPAIESPSKQDGLQALEHDAALMLGETPSQPKRSPQILFTSLVNKSQNSETAGDKTELPKIPRRRNMATSIAKRTLSVVVKRPGFSTRKLHDEDDAVSSASENYHQIEDEKNAVESTSDYEHRMKTEGAEEDRYFPGSDQANSSGTSSPSPASKHKSKRSTAAQEPPSALRRTLKRPRSLKPRPQHEFDVEESNVDADETGRTLTRENKCDECEKIFDTRSLLEVHKQETGHATDRVRFEVTGRFSEYEIQKLEKYKADFCRMYDINGHDFNEMMTDSCRRGVGQVWSYDIITKPEFLTQYFDVLPKRNRKSMARFRERNWQNAAGSKDWTVEDDDQIVKLVGEIGTKWVEIGQALTRTQDAVQQRWKKHLQYRKTKKGGIWSPEEDELLAKAVAGAKKRGGLTQDASTDERIAWSIVSDALNGTRTPKQCADHWQFQREKAGRRRPREKCKSKKANSTTKKGDKQLSNIYIDDSDNDIEIDDQGNLQTDESEEEQEEVHSHAGVVSTNSHTVDLQQDPANPVQHSEDDGFVSGAQSRRQSIDKRTPDHRISQEVSADEEGNEPLGSPELPLSLRRTPSKVTTLSQAFANTQANTSGLRRNHRHWHNTAIGRPSPRLPLELRPRSSVMEETPVDADEIQAVEDQESTTSQESSIIHVIGTRVNGDKSIMRVSELESESESESESDEDESVVGGSKNVENRSSPGETSEHDELADEDEEDVDFEDDLQLLPPMPQWVAFTEARNLLANDDDETSSEGEDSDSSDEETASASENDESEDSMVRDTRNDFMESIKQSAEKAKLAKWQKGKVPKPVNEDSDSEGDTESIAHG